MQTSQLLAEHMLPVTRSAMERLIDESRYYYYSTKFDTVAGMDPNAVTLVMEPLMVEQFLDESKASKYTVIEITDEDKARIMSFFDNCISYAHPDETIVAILNEELSDPLRKPPKSLIRVFGFTSTNNNITCLNKQSQTPDAVHQRMKGSI